MAADNNTRKPHRFAALCWLCIRCLDPNINYNSYRLQCTICQAVLRNPYQTPIGQRACKSCLVATPRNPHYHACTGYSGTGRHYGSVTSQNRFPQPVLQDRAFQRLDASGVMVRQCQCVTAAGQGEHLPSYITMKPKITRAWSRRFPVMT